MILKCVWRNGEDSTGEEIDKRKMNTERERDEMEVKVKESTRRSNGGINYFEQVNICVSRELCISLHSQARIADGATEVPSSKRTKLLYFGTLPSPLEPRSSAGPGSTSNKILLAPNPNKKSNHV